MFSSHLKAQKFVGFLSNLLLLLLPTVVTICDDNAQRSVLVKASDAKSTAGPCCWCLTILTPWNLSADFVSSMYSIVCIIRDTHAGPDTPYESAREREILEDAEIWVRFCMDGGSEGTMMDPAERPMHCRYLYDAGCCMLGLDNTVRIAYYHSASQVSLPCTAFSKVGQDY